MKNVHLIAAVGKRGQLGLNGGMPWHDPADLRWFRETTTNGILVMGSKTFAGIGYKLHGTHNRIVAPWVRDIDPKDLLEHLTAVHPHRTIWIAGGAMTYRAFMPFVDQSFIAHIDYDGPADVFMPPLWETSNAAE